MSDSTYDSERKQRNDSNLDSEDVVPVPSSTSKCTWNENNLEEPSEPVKSGKVTKRKQENANEEENTDEWIGPLPSEATSVQPPKKLKVLEHEHLFLNNLPSCESYEKSYMHRDVITHVVCTKTEFVITASCDGHVKFWKKMENDIEFVKHFRSHLSIVNDMVANCNGLFLCTISMDKSAKIFDIVNFDMINMMELNYVPYRAEWIHSPREPIFTLAISDSATNNIFIYDGKGTNIPFFIIDKIHSNPVVVMKYNVKFETVVSVDKSGILEYWGTAKCDYQTPKCVKFESKLDTDLFEFAKSKTYPVDISFSPDGKKFATISLDRKIRVFRFLTGKIILILDETLSRFTELQQAKQQLPNMEFGRRMACERDLDKSEVIHLMNIVFDESGNFILYGTLLGIKIINIVTNRCVKILGKPENLRPLKIALFQGCSRKHKAAVTVELEASENPTLEAMKADPTVFCTAFKKNRFYMFTRRHPDDGDKNGDVDRDVFNEKPSKEDVIAATESSEFQRVYENATIHTEMGDIHIKLFVKEAPKTCENFCVHSKEGYFNGHIFHRVIKGFMIQTGDPTGTGTGGESIWGGEFEDEFHSKVKHDRPYTLSMANAGPNTNGSQFFITVIPTPWLDNKHTVFGRVFKGMEVVQNIGNVKCNPKTNKPYEDVRIVSISLK
ncbi:Peptidylprolyl isomerase domain and WD repeat containing protein 1 [Polyplax serrata]|uniref:peptidylprolyl isomerase n=1 Tax=Polyplax serrata TaxID=468196 RepID=A0ABR1AXP7_POLSC